MKALSSEKGESMKRTSGGGMGTLKNYWSPSGKIEGIKYRPSYFIYKPNFWNGASSVVNPFKSYRWKLLRYEPPKVANFNAMREDWNLVGLDMRRAMESFRAKYPESFPEQERLFDPQRLEDS